MTARDVQRRLVVDRYRRSFVLCNYKPLIWSWECDVFEITKAGFFVEWEIKLSKSDFKADARKSKDPLWDNVMDAALKLKQLQKHELLRQHETTGPSRFWFVLPEGIVDLADVPVWAGVMRAHEQRGGWGPYRVRLQIERRAPTLHRQKVNPEVVKAARECCYWRLHSLFCFGKEQTIPPVLSEPTLVPQEDEPHTIPGLSSR